MAPASPPHQLARNGIFAKPCSLCGAVLGKKIDFRVDELRVFEHVGARILTGIAELRFDRQTVRDPAGRERFSRRREAAAPFTGWVADAPKKHVDLKCPQRL